MGLCYDCGFKALTVALALGLPGDYLPPRGPGGINQQESVAGLSGHSLLTAFPLKCGSLVRRPMEREGVRKSVADLLRHSLAAKGGNEGCWSGCLGRSVAENQTDRRASTFFLIGPGISTTVGIWHHRPNSIGTKQEFRKLRNYGICGIYGIVRLFVQEGDYRHSLYSFPTIVSVCAHLSYNLVFRDGNDQFVVVWLVLVRQKEDSGTVVI